MSTPRTPFVWHELLTADPEAAKAFYTAVFGWGTAVFDAGAPYAMWTNGEVPFGGIMQKPEGAESPPSWLGYLGVEDVDAVAKRVEERGGKIHAAPFDIPNAGRMAVFADPWGAVFAVHKSLQEAPPPGEPKVGNMSWNELATDDGAAALVWYGELFGWAKAGEHDMGDLGFYRLFADGPEMPFPTGGVLDRPPGMPAAWLYYVLVDDLEGKIAKVTERGGKLINGPMDVPGGDRIATCLDPQGAAFAMHQRKKA